MTKTKSIIFAAVSAAALAACGGSGGDSASRDSIRAVGSSTVFPFAKAVSEAFVRSNPEFRSPIIESTGTGGGMKLFWDSCCPNALVTGAASSRDGGCATRGLRHRCTQLLERVQLLPVL